MNTPDTTTTDPATRSAPGTPAGGRTASPAPSGTDHTGPFHETRDGPEIAYPRITVNATSATTNTMPRMTSHTRNVAHQ